MLFVILLCILCRILQGPQTPFKTDFYLKPPILHLFTLYRLLHWSYILNSIFYLFLSISATLSYTYRSINRGTYIYTSISTSISTSVSAVSSFYLLVDKMTYPSWLMLTCPFWLLKQLSTTQYSHFSFSSIQCIPLHWMHLSHFIHSCRYYNRQSNGLLKMSTP